MQRQFEHSLLAHKIDFQKTSYASRLPVYKIKNVSQAILDGLIEEDDYEMLFSIEPMPKYVVALDASVSDGGVDIVYPESGQRYET